MQECHNLISLEECLKVHFPLYLKTEVSVGEAHILISFLTSFQLNVFWIAFGGNVAH